MAILEFSTPPTKGPARKKLKMTLATLAIAASLTLSSTLAANISLNDSGNYEFGQGIVLTTVCTGTDSLTVTPTSNYENSSGEFKLSAITFSHVPDSCLGVEFKISIYSTSQLLDLDTGVQIARVNYAGALTESIFKGASGTETFDAEITDASVSGGYGTFTILLTGDPASSINIEKITLESSGLGACDGLSSTCPGVSAYQIHQDYPNLPSGRYWIQNANINNGDPLQIYADMTRDGGGWTLILANGSLANWNGDNALNLNSSTPPADPLNLTANYSIIEFADYIKKSASGFQYRIEATTPGDWGGVWTANQNYSFVSQLNTNTNITLNTKFGNWTYNNSGIEERMPYFTPGAQGIITTSISPDGEWWGTLVARFNSGGWRPAPWVGNSGYPGIGANGYPDIIWYWVR
jgi:hypothetical protein